MVVTGALTEQRFFRIVKLTLTASDTATDEVGVFAYWGEGRGKPLSCTAQAFRFVGKILESFLI
ncbi:MAG TPA: hypothetical protein VG488_13345 [Candidatus Angelobacter sp.]|jgi:hypothetical protein|nr:hypothetical protein [Candidatus Angelobacter sp.]